MINTQITLTRVNIYIQMMAHLRGGATILTIFAQPHCVLVRCLHNVLNNMASSQGLFGPLQAERSEVCDGHYREALRPFPGGSWAIPMKHCGLYSQAQTEKSEFTWRCGLVPMGWMWLCVCVVGWRCMCVCGCVVSVWVCVWTWLGVRMRGFVMRIA